MEKIKFQIEKLDYQEDAVNAVIDLLSGVDRRSVSVSKRISICLMSG